MVDDVVSNAELAEMTNQQEKQGLRVRLFLVALLQQVVQCLFVIEDTAGEEGLARSEGLHGRVCFHEFPNFC